MPVVTTLLLLGLWHIAAVLYNQRVLVPPPLDVAYHLVELVHSPGFLHHYLMTLGRGSVSFVVAMFLGTVLGLIMGCFPLVERALSPLLLLLINVPPIAWVVVLVLLFSVGTVVPILLTVSTTIPIVTMNILQGVRTLDGSLFEMARAFRVGKLHQARWILLPSLRGYMLAAAVLALRFTWRTLIMAEFLGSHSGIGYRLSWARQNVDMTDVIAYTIIILTTIVLLENVLCRFSRRVLRHHTGGC